MAKSVSQSESPLQASTLAKSLAPEDVCVGDYVAPLHETYDFPSFLWCCDAALTDRAETVTIRFRANSSGVPLKVKAICLPFVLVKHPVRGVYSLDVRRYQLVRLDRDYASVAWCSLKSRDQNRKHKKKRKQKSS